MIVCVIYYQRRENCPMQPSHLYQDQTRSDKRRDVQVPAEESHGQVAGSQTEGARCVGLVGDYCETWDKITSYNKKQGDKETKEEGAEHVAAQADLFYKQSSER